MAMTNLQNNSALSRLNSHRELPPFSQVIVVLAAKVAQWEVRRHTRKTLKSLTVSQLEDCGLTREMADTEAARPFWKG